jgi:riboflavin kinase/FMN adenylyltransferase
VKVYGSLEEFPRLEKAVVTIGTFDGVHIGHQRIIRRLSEIAREQQGETVVLTFFPHPRMVLQPEDNSLQLITTLRERQALLSRFGVENLIVQPFNKEFSRITAAGFVRDLLVKRVGMHTLVIGYDHHFGRNREGSFKDLEEMAPLYGFGLEEIPKQVVNELAVSSTKIRAALLNGDMDAANALLGHDFTLTGTVVSGDKLGRTIGFPTANLAIPESYKLIPADGIYAVWAEVSGVRHRGMLYIGNRPVVNGRFRNIEVNLFDFDRDIYDKEVTVHIKSRIRDDRNIASMEELRLLLEEDRRNATKILS